MNCYGSSSNRDVSPWLFPSCGSLSSSFPFPVHQCMGGRPSSPSSRSTSVQTVSVASSWGESYKGTFRQSRHSRSPSRISSRVGSASPCRGKFFSRFRSPSQSRRVDDAHQDEQSSLDVVAVVSHLCCLTMLLEAPSEGHKIRGFMAVLEDDDQPAVS